MRLDRREKEKRGADLGWHRLGHRERYRWLEEARAWLERAVRFASAEDTVASARAYAKAGDSYARGEDYRSAARYLHRASVLFGQRPDADDPDWKSIYSENASAARSRAARIKVTKRSPYSVWALILVTAGGLFAAGSVISPHLVGYVTADPVRAPSSGWGVLFLGLGLAGLLLLAHRREHS